MYCLLKLNVQNSTTIMYLKNQLSISLTLT